ncbi:hypothetical protein M3N64_04175 [Sporolactobacillus sp. CPB3-1]|uniref:SWIM-type domain-containing protein n=1 Tax=Sporolactobacillus mangiferae TaxID=2940498 RepID=A0ABT0M8D8_9BACL|nr:SWIM zinc finger family protein [Sporolactobacillus mangiferae]MCL1631143.1 hypothetical protein [Sporolactobacillus mangiferae]
MGRKLSFRNAYLADWLSSYAAVAGRSVFERGILLFDRHRVWDYHVSANRLHASVEDIHSTFFQVKVIWKADPSTRALPPDLKKLHVHCSCPSRKTYCEHITAAMIYWIMRLDKTEPAHFSINGIDTGDSPDYRNRLNRLRKLTASELPSYSHFDASKLVLRPDLQINAEQIMQEVMAHSAHRSDFAHE